MAPSHPLRLSFALTFLLVTAGAAAAPSDWRSGWQELASSPPARTRDRDEHGLAALRLTQSEGGARIHARNLTAGPVQVRLRSRRGARDELALIEHVLPAGHQQALLTLKPDASSATTSTWLLEAVPGRPHARPQPVLYQLPFTAHQVRIDQGFGGQYSHSDAENRFALDFPLDEGTPVLAARGGVVMQVIDHHRDNHQDRDRSGEGANLVRVLHPDGSMALYAHLSPGAAVRPGQQVATGTLLGYSGNTGFSTAPHLHFAIQRNAGMALESVPFRLAGPRGELQFPRPAPAASSHPDAVAGSPL